MRWVALALAVTILVVAGLSSERTILIVWESAGINFTLRTAAVIVADGQVLVTRLPDQDFWYLPGGRVEMGEPSDIALRRELEEEIGVAAEVGRLLWVVENFYGTQPRQHELGLYYAASTPTLRSVWDGTGIYRTVDEAGQPLQFRRVPLGDLQSVRLMPPFLQTALLNLPDHPKHVITRQEEGA